MNLEQKYIINKLNVMVMAIYYKWDTCFIISLYLWLVIMVLFNNLI